MKKYNVMKQWRVAGSLRSYDSGSEWRISCSVLGLSPAQRLLAPTGPNQRTALVDLIPCVLSTGEGVNHKRS